MLSTVFRRGLATSTRALAAAPASSAAAASTSVYPFAAQAKLDTTPRALDPALKAGKGLMLHLQRTLPPPDKQAMLARFLVRDGPERVLPGSVLTVHSTHAPTLFSGVLVSVRRRGPDTSFVLRNIVQRTGVEIQFYVNSPHVTKIDVVRRGPASSNGKGGRSRRAKLFYLRHSSEKMSNMSSA
jgi:large subunit ribosomal protein L19